MYVLNLNLTLRTYKTEKPFDLPSFTGTRFANLVFRDNNDTLVKEFSPKTMFNILLNL